jgi:hypothetical protein
MACRCQDADARKYVVDGDCQLMCWRCYVEGMGGDPGTREPELGTAGDTVRAKLIAEWRKRRRGESGACVLPSPGNPMAVAEELVNSLYLDRGTNTVTLRHHRGRWLKWERSKWVEAEATAVRTVAYLYTEHAVYRAKVRGGLRPWAPNRRKIADLLDALAAITYLDDDELEEE